MSIIKATERKKSSKTKHMPSLINLKAINSKHSTTQESPPPCLKSKTDFLWTSEMGETGNLVFNNIPSISSAIWMAL